MSKPDIGSTFAIATGLPSAFTEVGYEALTWVVVGGVLSIGERGDENSDIAVPGDLVTGRARTEKGEFKGMASEIVCREITADSGQIALRAAAAANGALGEYSFRIGDPGPALAPEAYTSGHVKSLVNNARDTGSYAGFKCMIIDNYGITRGT